SIPTAAKYSAISASSCTISPPGGTCWSSPRPPASSTRSSSRRSRNSCTIRPAGRRRTAASRRPRNSIEFDNTFEVPLRPDHAYTLCPALVGIALRLPGPELTDVVDDRNYKGQVSVRLGPVALTFAGLVTFEEIDNNKHTARIRAQGSDAKGRGAAQAAATF